MNVGDQKVKTRPILMLPYELQDLRVELGLTRAEVAAILEMSASRYGDFEKGFSLNNGVKRAESVPSWLEMAMRELARRIKAGKM